MTDITPPIAPKKDHTIVYHGKDYQDPYFWLRNKEAPEVIDYLTKENQFFEQKMHPYDALVDELYQELISRTKEDDKSVPEKHGPFYYYYRIEKGKNYRIYCRKKDNLESQEEVFLDLNKLAEGKKFLHMGSYDISPDHSFIAYTMDFSGYENFTLFIKNLITGETREFEVSNLDNQILWGLDNNTLFYCKRDKIHRSSYNYKGIINFENKNQTKPEEELLYFEPDEVYDTALNKTKDEKYIIITSSSKETTEVRFYNLKDNTLHLFCERTFSILYYLFHQHDYFYILTNEQAVNFKVLRVRVENFQDKSKWEDFVPANDERNFTNLEMFDHFIVLYNRKNGLKNISIYNMETKTWHDVALPEPIYAINYRSSPANYEYKANVLRFYYESLKTPISVYDYNMSTQEMTLLKKDEIKNFEPDNYVMKREFASARDGTQIPLSVVHLKSLATDKPNPTYLYGYGSYGMSIEPGFNANIISLLERGFIYIIAHIRGGGEMGRPWYLNGKYLSKKNTFKDFVDAAQFLIKQNYTNSSKLTIAGRSAGGLLMGAVLNMAPQLFKVAVMGVPFVDVINTMMDETIPLTTFEWEEWGDPRKKEFFDYMSSYSPYDNITKQNYPNILVTAGLNDSRVAYWEPAKFVSKLRQYKTDNNELLFKINMDAGHSGASGKYTYLKELAYEYAFILSYIAK